MAISDKEMFFCLIMFRFEATKIRKNVGTKKKKLNINYLCNFANSIFMF